MKLKNISILAFLIVFVMACQKSDWEYDNLFPEEYEVVFSIKNAQNINHDISRHSSSSTYMFTILKGGSQPSFAADVTLETWTAEEVEEYGTVLGINYRLLPPDSYTLSDITAFDGTKRGQDVVVTFKSQILVQYTDNNPEVTYLLPLRLVSEKTVNNTRKEILITPCIID